MPDLVDTQSRFTPKLLGRRESRQQRAMQLVKVHEVGAIALNLRHARIRLGSRLRLEIPSGNPNDIKLLTDAFCRVNDQLLRLARVPQAPPGHLKGEDKRPTLDLVPELSENRPIPESTPA